MLVGMALFGIEAWSERGDAFGGYFGLLARLSPLAVHDGALWLRRPLSGVTSLREERGHRRAGARDHRDHDVRRRLQRRRLEHAAAARPELLLEPRPRRDAAPDELADSLGLLLAIAIVSGLYRIGILGMRTVSRRFDTRVARALVRAHARADRLRLRARPLLLAADLAGPGDRLPRVQPARARHELLRDRRLARQLRLHRLNGHLVRAGARARRSATSAGSRSHTTARSTIFRSPREAAQSQYWMLVVMVGFTSLGLWLLSAVNT